MGTTETFTYDDAGNLTTDGFEYDTSNRLTMYNNVAVYYDPDGNMVCSPLGEGFFDSANRLTSFNTTSYDYDVENIRVRKTYGETVTTYTHNANSKLSQLLTKTENGVTTYYIYGLGLIYETTETDCKVYHYDYRGSTVALTDINGTKTDTFEYDTYGKLTTRTGTAATPFLYNGRDGVMTDENGLVYMRARYYSPTLKRFINADVIAGSITNAITLNRYAYANGNPVSNVDPFGLSADEARGTQGTAISTDSSSSIDFDFNEWYTDDVSDAIHNLLDLAGFIPGFGSVADALNALVYAFEGDWINAGMSAFSALPGIGDIAAGCKWATKFFKASSKIGRALESVSTILSKTDEMMAAMTSFGRVGDNLGFIANYSDDAIEETAQVIRNATGQKHHILSNPIMKELNSHETLKGLFDRNSSVVRAMNKEAHNGYQTWHRTVDNTMVDWLKENILATPNEFWSQMKKLYNDKDVYWRFGDAAINYIEGMMK